MSLPLHSRSACDLAAAIRKRELRALTLLDHCLARTDAYNDRLNAFVEVWRDQARARAKSVDQALDRGEDQGPLAGIPIGIKDNFCRRGHRTSCASDILADFVSPYTATAIERLETAGAIILGRCNMDEFAMGSSCEHSRYGPSHNPFDLSRSPGGSSGGSAAAVAAGLVPLALGSDTGGSVRQPAALCGISGLKPSYGRISRHGLVAFASSLDHVAPMARRAEDLSLMLKVMAGPDAQDATSIDCPADPAIDARKLAEAKLTNLRVGVPEEYFSQTQDPEITEHVRRAIADLRDLGAEIITVSLPHTRYAIPAYHLIATAEAASNLSRYDGMRYGRRSARGGTLEELYTRSRSEGFGNEVKLRILLGTYCLQAGSFDAHYKKASQVRTLIRRDFEQAFSHCDILVTPTTPIPAFPLGSKLDDPLAMYQNDVLTAPANLAGIPALQIPCGFTEAGLPIGMQVIGPVLAETRLLRTAHVYQTALPEHLREPAL